MKSKEIRDAFLAFFQSKDHLILPSFSLIPQNDPTLLLIGAGMAPLKPYFTGEKKPPHPRIATCQKCVRTPDIEKVGTTVRHATFFEMLGNFSFGDYFKEEAIAWSWELMTKGFKLPEERLFVSIYENDDEAFSIWHKKIGVPEAKIYRLGKEDNFWEIGQGPCGPCSEIYYDLGLEMGCGKEDCKVGCDCDRFLEVWNLVFTQFNKEADGSYTPLKQKNIDTGAGLERLAVVLQGVPSLFEIDIIKPILEYFADMAGYKYGSDEKGDVSIRIITEHMRGVAFMVGDGVMPSNEGRGYVLRRILRRAVRHGKLLEMEPPFLYKAVPLLGELMGDTYPELLQRQDYIMRIIQIEEERFKETLEQGTLILMDHIAELKDKGKNVLKGETAFKLYDTFGFPLELTREILKESGMTLDESGFERALEEQKERARAALSFQLGGRDADDLLSLVKDFSAEFLGYETLSAEGEVLALISREGQKLLREVKYGAEGKEFYLLLDRTPFYAERGGQVGDTGIIELPSGKLRVKNTVSGPAGQVLHLVELLKGSIRQGDRVTAKVDVERRKAIARNHTATHLLHRALKDVLGEHVNQYGSLVAPDRLRFDFTHFAPLEEDEMEKIVESVNKIILENRPVDVEYTRLEEALNMGAVALFEEKYGEKVRVVKIDGYSLELCGGTHVEATGEIGLFYIVAEGSVAAGVRRIEALTGLGALRHFLENERVLESISQLVKATPDCLPEKIGELMDSQRELQRKVKRLQQKIAQQQVENLLKRVDFSLGFPVLSAQVEAENMETLREYLDRLKDRLKSGIIMLGAHHNGKVLLAAAVTRDLVDKGFHAGKLVEEAARVTGGGGGGRPDLAQAGGKKPENLPLALGRILELVREQQKDKDN